MFGFTHSCTGTGQRELAEWSVLERIGCIVFQRGDKLDRGVERHQWMADGQHRGGKERNWGDGGLCSRDGNRSTRMLLTQL